MAKRIQSGPPVQHARERPDRGSLRAARLELQFPDVASPQKRAGNWNPDGRVEQARLRRDYLESEPAQRIKQVCELSRFMSRVAAAGSSQRRG
jgi:hypothetical protein